MEFDLTKGHMVQEVSTVHIEAVAEQKAEGYFDQDNGGQYVETKPYIAPVEEHDEEVITEKYVLYTKQELEAIEREKQMEEYRSELAEKEQWLKDHDYIGTKIATGRATIEDYQTEINTMMDYADRINAIKVILGANK